MSALQQTHGFPPTLTVLETREAGQRRVFAQAPFHSCQGNPGRPQPKWLSGGASEPSSHGEEGGESWLLLAEPTAQLRFHFPLKENALDGR